MKKTALLIACAGLMIAGIGLAAPKSADAGIRVSIGSGYGGYGFNRGYGYSNYGHYGHGHGGFYTNSWYGRPSYGSYYGGSHFGRGHYHYNPPVVVPHGNHYHVIPGDVDYHRGGHHYGH